MLKGQVWLTFLFLYFAFYALRLHSHVFWRDEAQAWLIAKESSSLGKLLDNLEFEGHPPIWYLLIKLTLQITPSIEGMKILTLIIFITTVYILYESKLFSRFELTLVLFGFLMFSGYTVISRPYLLGFLFLLIGVLQSKRSTNPFISYALLSLAVLTHILFIPLALGLTLCVFLLRYKLREGHFQFTAEIIPTFISIGTSLLVIGTSYPGTSHQVQPSEFIINANTFNEISHGIIQTYLPYFFGRESQLEVWSTTIKVITLLSLLFIVAFSFINNPIILGSYLACMVILIINFLWGYGKGWWHTGVGFLGFLAFLSLSRIWHSSSKEKGEARSNSARYIQASVHLLLALQVTGNFNYVGQALLMDKPYSNSKAVAMYLRDKCNQECSLFSQVDSSTAAISAYLGGKQINFLGSDRAGTFTLWRKDEKHMATQAEVEERIVEVREGFLITNKETALSLDGLELVMETFGAVWSDEDFKIYRIENQSN